MKVVHSIWNEDPPDRFTDEPQTADAQNHPPESGPRPGAQPRRGNIAFGLPEVFQKDGSQWNGCQYTDDDVQQEDPLRDHAITNQEGKKPTEGYKKKNSGSSS